MKSNACMVLAHGVKGWRTNTLTGRYTATPLPANKVHGQRDQCNNQEDVDQTGRDVKGQES